MKNILNINDAIELSKALHTQGKQIVLAGGCFDILHPGHFQLLQNAKEQGDILFILLESDKKITEIKGHDRPIHTQQERAAMLALIKPVDYVILLPYIAQNLAYDTIITDIHPDVIATTQNDLSIKHKKRQAEKIHANVVEVTKYIPHKSTTKVIQLLSQEQ